MPAPHRTRRDLEIISHLRGTPLAQGAPNILGKDFPLGEGWYRLLLRFNIALTVGSAATPISEGELNIIKNIVFRTSAGEIICNLPGRALWKIAAVKGGTLPRKDAIAAGTATYSVDLPIYFTDDRMKRPEDTILDTSRYSALSLEITYGTVADLFAAPGTATMVCTLDAEIERTKGRLPKKALPIFHVFYGSNPSQDASVQTYIDIDRAPDVAYKRFFAHACTGGVAGGVFTGVTSDAVQSLERIVDQSGDICRDRIHEQIQNMNKNDYALESVLAGISVFDFVRDGSVNSALYPGDRSRLQYKWDNKAGVVAGYVVSLAHEAVRGLKG
jgi:hypothetical protein